MGRTQPPEGEHRAAYPSDAPARNVPGEDRPYGPGYMPPAAPADDAADEGVPYPDMVYEAEARQTADTAALPIQRAAYSDGGRWSAPSGWLPDPDSYPDNEETDDSAVTIANGSAPAGPRASQNSALWAMIAAVSTLLLAFMLYYVWQLYQDWAPFRQKVDAVMGGTIAQGVTVDQVDVGGMTRDQASAALQTGDATGAAPLGITLQVDGKVWVITEEELPLERNVQSVLDTAWSIGRQGSPATIASQLTPFEYRYRHLYHTAGNPVALTTSVDYDPGRVRELVGLVADYVNREAVDAQVASFDYARRSFTFTDDVAGARLDSEEMVQRIMEALDQHRYNATIYMALIPVTPRITKAELINSFTLISSYTTQTTSDANRNTNIQLAAQAVMGTAVMPGETFSFNGATGERTVDKGYMPAAAIADGATVEDIGGGVCQVSSTLFNAAAMADMTIIERWPHTWPSNYVEKGRDATVNWPNLDFQFRNDRSTPVFIVAWYQDRQCTVEIYGASLGEGERIELLTRLVAVTDPPAEPAYAFNPDLPYGTMTEKKKARTGYDVETYRVYTHNGQETRRELLCVSSYPAIQQVMEYNY